MSPSPALPNLGGPVKMAIDLLRMFGVPDDEAREICSCPLPSIDLMDLTI